MTMIEAKYASNVIFTKGISYLSLPGQLLDAFGGDIDEN